MEKITPQVVKQREPAQVIRPPRIVVSTILLYNLYSILFPAERIVLIAGHGMYTSPLSARLEGIFDVTSSQTHPAHGKADSDKLDRALRLMDYSGTGVGAWAHSHPGKGKGATSPSPTDRVEHASWLKGYSRNLLGIIMVEDGFCRVFGDAIEDRPTLLQIVGKGVVQVDEFVYKLTKER